MTLATMQWHESVTLRYSKDDFRRKSLMQLARRYVVGKRVLDMRCLTGHLAVGLAADGFEVTGLDGYPEAVDMTNELARSRGITKPIAQLWDLNGLVVRVGENRFDTVICLDILNHVPNDQATVPEIARVLAPGGRLILVVPAVPMMLGRRDQTLGHLRRYTKAGICELLERNGLKIQSIRSWNFAALPVYFLMEKVFRKRLPDGLRYGRGKVIGPLPNYLLGWWYLAVENRLWFPCGLSFFVIAQKADELTASRS